VKRTGTATMGRRWATVLLAAAAGGDDEGMPSLTN